MWPLVPVGAQPRQGLESVTPCEKGWVAPHRWQKVMAARVTCRQRALARAGKEEGVWLAPLSLAHNSHGRTLYTMDELDETNQRVQSVPLHTRRILVQSLQRTPKPAP